MHLKGLVKLIGVELPTPSLLSSNSVSTRSPLCECTLVPSLSSLWFDSSSECAIVVSESHLTISLQPRHISVVFLRYHNMNQEVESSCYFYTRWLGTGQVCWLERDQCAVSHVPFIVIYVLVLWNKAVDRMQVWI